MTGVQVEGDATLFAQLAAYFDTPSRLWNMALPLGYDNSRSNKVNTVAIHDVRLEQGALAFTVEGVPGYPYSVNASSNMTDWRTVYTNVSPFSYVDPGHEEPSAFFRSTYSGPAQ